MNVRYVLHPGYVYCEDGDKHYISTMTLVRLYDLYNEDFVEYSSRGFSSSGRDIHLYPQNSGVYDIYTKGRAMFSNTFIKTTVEELLNTLEETRKSLDYIRSLCQHTDTSKEYGSNTGHLSEVDDMYWIKHTCNVCGKKWTTDQE